METVLLLTESILNHNITIDISPKKYPISYGPCTKHTAVLDPNNDIPETQV